MDKSEYMIDFSKFQHPADAWLFALPEDPYEPCPCGCGVPFRFISRTGEKEISKHFEKFVAKFHKAKESEQTDSRN